MKRGGMRRVIENSAREIERWPAWMRREAGLTGPRRLYKDDVERVAQAIFDADHGPSARFGISFTTTTNDWRTLNQDDHASAESYRHAAKAAIRAWFNDRREAPASSTSAPAREEDRP